LASTAASESQRVIGFGGQRLRVRTPKWHSTVEGSDDSVLQLSSTISHSKWLAEKH
jgi:hypothetical protein